nr:RCC1 domain-containing protein [Chloroflexus sp.]
MTPVAVSGLTGAIAIAAGLEHTCALLNDGTARCWGDNFSSQLGDGTAGYSPTPVQVAGSGRGEAPQPLIFYSDDRKAGV